MFCNDSRGSTDRGDMMSGVRFGYIDNSNLWIEGQRLQAVKQGHARDPYDAMRQRVFAPWSYDFRKLYRLLFPLDVKVGRSLAVVSTPTPDGVPERLYEAEFEVRPFPRNAANREKQVDCAISVTMLEDSFEHMRVERGDMAVLVAGDEDYLPAMESLRRRNLPVRVIFWRHATDDKLREGATEFIELDPHFNWLTHPA